MSAALYLATAVALLLATNRWLREIKRWVAIVLILLPLIFTGRALLIDGLFGPFDLPYETDPLVWQRSEHGIGGAYNGMVSDLYTQIIPYRKAVRDALARGEWPLWNPYTLSGEPLAAEAQPAVYSPFTLLACLLPVAKSFTFSATLWFFIAALAAFAFAREVGCSDIAALTAGLAFMAASSIVFFVHWPLGQSWILLPFVFLGVRRLVAQPALLLIALTLLIFTGHPESVLHVVFLGAAYGVFRMFWGRPWTTLLHAAAVGVLTLGLCAIYLLPFREASLQTEDFTNRTHLFSQWRHTVNANESIVILTTDFVADLQQRLWLKGYGVAPYTAAVGSLALSLAIYALWRARGAEKWFLAGLLVFCLLEHVKAALEGFMQHLPLFNIAINDRFAFGAAFAFAMLAGMGVDALVQRSDTRIYALCGLATLILVHGILHVVEHNGLVTWSHEMWGEYRRSAELLLLGIAVVLVILRPRIAAPALFACLLVQRTMQENGVYPTWPAHAGYPPVPLFEPLAKIREPFRILGIDLVFLPGTNAFYGLEDVRGYSPMTSRRYSATYPLWCRRQPIFVNVVDSLNHPFLSFLNVRYGILPKGFPTPPDWREVHRYRGAKLVENERVIPRAFVPSIMHIGVPEPLMEMSLADDLRKETWIEATIGPVVRSNGPGRVTAIRRRNLGFDIGTVMDGNGWVVISEPAWAGWRAYIDGRRVQHQIANMAFLAVYVPAGIHEVRLLYWPRSFVVGRGISAATLAIIIALLFYRSARGRRRIRAA